MNFKDRYNFWINSDFVDDLTKKELLNIKDEKEIEDRFYKELKFGTGGLRGIMGAGTNRMNKYTVSKATQGLSDYLNEKFKESTVCIGYDSRNNSSEFAKSAAKVLCGNGIKVYLFDNLRPTPMLSFAVRFMKANAGIVITASHNPKAYNGYKVYGKDGGQITDKIAKEVLNKIDNVKKFNDIKTITIDEAKNNGLFNIMDKKVDDEYIKLVKNLSIRKQMISDNATDLKIIYTPIHGSGNLPVRRVLSELGYRNVNIVKDQEKPNGNFPTVEYPNPEDPRVFKIALEMAKDIKPDLIFGTDPDSDRIGVITKNKDGEYKVLTGNQTGVLIMNYILMSLKEKNIMPQNSFVVKTIVTTEMARVIAKNYNVEIIDVLTGFKYIGEKIKELDENGDKNYIFGFEESYGYLMGNFVRDKDAVIAAMIICEMALYYKLKGMTLYDALIELYNRYGFYKEELVSITLNGKEGQEKIEKLMECLRHTMKASIDGIKIKTKFDYKVSLKKDLVNIDEEIIDLPKSNVLKFILEDNSWFVIRPSGTEPKIKLYFSVIGQSLEDSQKKLNKLKEDVMSIIK